MKKLTVILAILVLALSVAMVGAAPSSYDAGFQVQNLSTTNQAAVVIDYIDMAGNVVYQANETINAGASATFFPLHTGVPAGFDGSVVISSDQPVAAIVNLLGNGFAFGASYSGFSAGAQVINIPLVMKANYGFDTWLNVQNTDTTGSTNVTITYSGTACSETATIPPGAAHRFNQGTNSCLPNGYVGAATVTAGSGGSIVATIVQTTNTQLLAYNGFLAGSPNIVMPLVQMNNYGYDTGIQIQNTGNVATDITVTYTPSTSTVTGCTETITNVGAGASATFALHLPCLQNQQRWVGGAAVTGNTGGTDLVALINQTNYTTKGAAYGSFNPGSATSRVLFPLIMEENYGYFTGFNIVNLGGGTPDTANVTCTFSNSTYTVSQSLPVGGVLNAVQLNTALPFRYVGNAVCTDTNGNSLIGVVNELSSTGSGDTFYTYEGFNN